jgi:hypothetical protein
MRSVTWLRLGRDTSVLLGVPFAVAMWWNYSFGGLAPPVDARAYWASRSDVLARRR